MKRPSRPRRRYAFPSCWARRIEVASAAIGYGEGSWEEMKNWGETIGPRKPARLRIGLSRDVAEERIGEGDDGELTERLVLEL